MVRSELNKILKIFWDKKEELDEFIKVYESKRTAWFSVLDTLKPYLGSSPAWRVENIKEARDYRKAIRELSDRLKVLGSFAMDILDFDHLSSLEQVEVSKVSKAIERLNRYDPINYF